MMNPHNAYYAQLFPSHAAIAPQPEPKPKKPPAKKQKRGKKNADETQEIANFLLSLKHGTSRSSSPEPKNSGRSTKKKASSKKKATGPSYDQSAKNNYSSYADQQQMASQMTPYESTFCLDSDSLAKLLGDSKLVQMKDRDLIPDSLFVAMAQMRPCRLSQADRVGCYKSREIGFLGMCCKHCGGQPGFGRFYPNSVRSLAQTTTSQTILKHVSSKCRFCPPEVRIAVVELQRQQVIRENSPQGRPRYGSRKIFFQRVWARLHGTPEKTEDEESSKTDDTASMNSESDFPTFNDFETAAASSAPKKRQSRFGSLPAQDNNKRAKVMSSSTVLPPYHAI